MYRDEKIVHMAAYLIKKLGGEMERLKLMKLLYLTDRKSLKDRGYSISRDEFVSMPQGPVLLNADRFMKGENPEQSVWDSLIKNIDGESPHHTLRDDSPYLGALSSYDGQVMDEVVGAYGNMTYEAFKKFCIEWKDPGDSSEPVPIRVKEILQKLGYSREDAEYYESHAAELDAIESGAYGI